jgi:CarD family transcriptional regulator
LTSQTGSGAGKEIFALAGNGHGGSGVRQPSLMRLKYESETNMAQKKKAPQSTKTAAKTVARKSAPAKTATPVKSAKTAAKPLAKQPAVAAKAAVASKAKPVAAAPVKSVAKAAVAPAVVKAAVKSAVAAAAIKKPALAALAAKAASAAAAQRAVPAAAHKATSQKVSAPVSAAVAAAAPKAVAEKTAAARQLLAVQKKPVNQRHGFKANEYVVYPAHGVGRIVGIEEQEIAGMSLELFVITFDKEKLTLRVPTGKLESVGMRKLADEPLVKKAMDTLKGRARIKRTMWSRRAQEYVAKINSGDLISIAEVVRDLYRSEAQPEQSYSERQLYEDALDRMARELAAVEKLDDRGAVQRITEVLSKSAKSRRAAVDAADAADADDDAEEAVGEAA